MNFDFSLPGLLGTFVEFCFELGIVITALAGGVYALKRALIAWRDRGTLPAFGMVRREDLLNEGLPILNLLEAKKVGKAKDVILDLASGRVAGFWAKSKPLVRCILPFEQVKAIGPDAIIVESASSLLDPRATPALLNLAGQKFRRTDCRVLTESGKELGELSWRELRFDPVSGEVQIALKVKGSTITGYLIDLLFDVVSIFQPLDEWFINPYRLELHLPLSSVLKANRNLVIVGSQAEAECRQQLQTIVNQQNERLRNTRERCKLTLVRAWRRVTGKTL